jgi:DNA (cytosine-5)-methyltransferase 1
MNNYAFPYKWFLKDGYPKTNNLNVFGTFICGGGSTMGYKLAGFNHLGGIEIDERVASVYKTNHNPKHLFVEDLRKFNERDNLPDELFDLDILDGSPPCSTFSICGSREKAWGKKKKFREGQAEQVLDDLVFVYVETIKKLRPKVFILENVKGIIQGNARSYSKNIVKQLKDIGYKTQIFLLNSASMGVPQRRERVFFVGLREDIKKPVLKLSFNEKPITYGEIDHYKGRSIGEDTLFKKRWDLRIKSDKRISDICKRTENKDTSFNTYLAHKDNVFSTVTSGGDFIKHHIFEGVSNKEFMQIGSFPMDYDFKKLDPKYLIGMSVPPVMIAQIADQIYQQWFK